MLSATQKATLHPMTAAHLTDSIGFNIPLALRNQVELERRVAAGEVISGAELKARYFPLQSDYDTVATWLKGEGFTVDAVADTNLAVFAHGTTAQIQASFQVTMGLITANATDRVVTLTAPSLPAAIAGPALGVSGLSYRRPQSRLMHPSAATPRATGVPANGYHINQLATAYGGTGLKVNGTTLTGAGQTIAIESYVQVQNSDLNAFWSANGVTRTGTVTTVNVDNATLETDDGNVEENALDVEWASGMAPGANVVDYATDYDGNDAPERIYNRVITDASAAGSTVHQLTSSYGPTEAELTATELSAFNQIFLSLTAAGCTYINATGDIGYTPVEAYGNFPYTLGVGGTTLNVDTSTFARATETGWSGSSGGVSAKYAHPAWQTGTGTIAADNRQFPDIALAADPNTPAYFVYSGNVGEVGGTSWSAPTFAGFLALLQQGRALNTPSRGPVGFLNPRLYPLILSGNFFDVTSGNNGDGNGSGYNAGTGYDMVTGIGVPKISSLLATLLGPTVTGFTPAQGAAGTSVVITGTNFYANTGYPVSVTFNGLAATSVTVNSPTQITAVTPSGATAGPIVVTSFGDTATSSTNFTGPAPAQITSQPASQVILSNEETTLSVGVVGDNVTVQWYVGLSGDTSAPISGATSTTYSTDFLTATTHFWVQASNAITSVDSQSATVTVASNLALANSTIYAVTGQTFPQHIVLTATDNTGTAVPGLHVAFQLPSIATFPGNTPSDSDTTNSSGAATSSTITAKANAGSGTAYIFVSDALGGLRSLTMNLIVNAPTTVAGYLAGYGLTGANAAPAADPNGDGVTNLMAYALGLNPTVPSTSALPQIAIKNYSGVPYAFITFTRSSLATDLTYIVEESSDLENWSAVATSSGGAATSGSGFVGETQTGTTFLVEARSTFPVNSADNGRLVNFLRLRVTSP